MKRLYQAAWWEVWCFCSATSIQLWPLFFYLSQDPQLCGSSVLKCCTVLFTLDLSWYDSVKASYHHIKHYIFWHQLTHRRLVLCDKAREDIDFSKWWHFLNSGHASCLTCSNLSVISNGLWVCVCVCVDVWLIYNYRDTDWWERQVPGHQLSLRRNIQGECGLLRHCGCWQCRSGGQSSPTKTSHNTTRLQRRGWGVSHPFIHVMMEFRKYLTWAVVRKHLGKYGLQYTKELARYCVCVMKTKCDAIQYDCNYNVLYPHSRVWKIEAERALTDLHAVTI